MHLVPSSDAVAAGPVDDGLDAHVHAGLALIMEIGTAALAGTVGGVTVVAGGRAHAR